MKNISYEARFKKLESMYLSDLLGRGAKFLVMVSLFFLPVLFSSCVSKPLSFEKAKSIKSMSYVIAFEDEIYGSYVGTTVFNNKNFTYIPSEWIPSDFLAEDIEAAFSHIKMKRMAVTRMDEKPRNHKNIYLDEAEAMNTKYLLVISEIGYDFAQQTNLESGLGILCQSHLGKKFKPKAYVKINFNLYDVVSRKRILTHVFQPLDGPRFLNIAEIDGDCHDFSEEKLKTLFKNSIKQFEEMLKDETDSFMENSGLVDTAN